MQRVEALDDMSRPYLGKLPSLEEYSAKLPCRDEG